MPNWTDFYEHWHDADDEILTTQGREMLTEYERHLISVSLDRYRHDIREACEEDQGTPEGQPGTLGHSMQIELRELEEKVRNNRG